MPPPTAAPSTAPSTAKSSSAAAPAAATRPRLDTSALRHRGPVYARTIGALTPRVTKTAFQKFGFATAQLIGDWPKIVGHRLAATTAPDRIRWPRRPDDLEAAGGRKSQPRGGAVLVIRVEPAVALDVQYQTALILDRINSYFGYRAVAEIRIVQGAVATEAAKAAAAQILPPARTRPAAPPPAREAIGAIADDGLRAALERMQNGLMTRRR